ncbi:mitochondrial outer membrane protein porin 2-like isoform X2 [Aristolochia californica]|uniref:mitochondrial outer membrane protein porin 2-like isoform X2 n=1 Tax=Aristolochia californica TaxID=171875 RepID=UPI0035E1ED73
MQNRTWKSMGSEVLTSAVIKKGGLSTGDVTAAYKYHNTNIDVKVDTESKILTTLTFSDVLPSTKFIASLRLPDYTSGKVEVQYFRDIAAATVATTLNNQSPVVDLSLTLGTPSFSAGGEAAFDSTASSFTKYNAGISVKMPDSTTDIVLAEKADMLKLSFVHDLGEEKKSAIVAEFTRRFSTNENTITVGGCHALESFTTVKGRLNNHGQLGALLQHEVKPNSILTISGIWDSGKNWSPGGWRGILDFCCSSCGSDQESNLIYSLALNLLPHLTRSSSMSASIRVPLPPQTSMWARSPIDEPSTSWTALNPILA